MSDVAVPSAIAAERAVLGCLLMDGTQIATVADWLEPSWFYLYKHEVIYQAALACYRRHEAVTLPAIITELKRHPVAGPSGEAWTNLDVAGGLAYLGELAARPYAPTMIADFARPVEVAAVRRRLIEAGGRITAIGYDQTGDLDTDLDTAEQELLSVSGRRRRDAAVGAELGACVTELWELISTRMLARQNGESGLVTGFVELDRLLMLNPGEMTIIAARPGVGKTAMALSIASYMAGVDRRRIGIYSLEMSREVLTARLTSQRTGIAAKRILTGDLRSDEEVSVSRALGEIGDWPIYIADRFELSGGGLRAHARAHHARQPWDLIIVDYLQLLITGGKQASNDTRAAQVAELSRGLVTLARELAIPVIALSQLNRAVETRATKLPQLSDLRESGSLEQDARQVIFIHREELYDPKTDKVGIADVIVAKNNNGETGTVTLYYDRRKTLFQNLERYTAPEGYGEEYADAA